MPTALPLLLLISAAVAASADEAPTATLALGTIRGTVLTSVNGLPFAGFSGIPFAVPPVDDKRFSRPEPYTKPFEGVFEANKAVKCFQVAMDEGNKMGNNVDGVEDCLVMNVYTPRLKSSASEPLLPVMAFIHGGGFLLGSGETDLYGAERLIDYGVILVTFNYRLGPLGFMSMGDDVLPANLGLWDQTLALKWIQENIAAFGGDKKQVTIFGESAGGMSVYAHLMSPASSGLFSKAIAQSGVLNSVFCESDKHPAYYTRTLASNVGCNPEGTSQEIKDCFLKVDAKTLVNNAMNGKQTFSRYPYPYKPIVDDFSATPFLPAEPLELVSKGAFNQVPTIIGYNRDEGLLNTARMLKYESELKEVADEWDVVVPFVMFGRAEDEITAVEQKWAERMLSEVFGGRKPSAEVNFDRLTELYTDGNFGAISTHVTELVAAKSKQPVYEYLYSHVGSLSLTDIFVESPYKLLARALGRYVGLDLFNVKYGCCHGDELFMLFKGSMIPMETVYSDEDKVVSAAMLAMWTDFAKTGNPTPEGSVAGVKWEKLDPKSPKRLEIDSKLSFGPHSPAMLKRLDFWRAAWKDLPPNMHLKRSKTWSNPKMYDKKKSKSAEEKKQEL